MSDEKNNAIPSMIKEAKKFVQDDTEERLNTFSAKDLAHLTDTLCNFEPLLRKAFLINTNLIEFKKQGLIEIDPSNLKVLQDWVNDYRLLNETLKYYLDEEIIVH